MCGICGIVSLNGERIDFNDIKKMNDLLIHRGPDDEGFYIKNNTAIAMRRLAIIDLKTGKQPISNEDGKINVVLNGEIYNFNELRDELVLKGHRFKTKTDTETIVHLYEEYGEDFVSHLRGMFALCIYDETEDKIIIARDRLGKKPLYYYFDNSYFAFSSELNSLASFNKLKLSLNPTSIDSYLVLQYIPSPITVYKEIKKLPQSSILTLHRKELKIKKYWELPTDEIDISFEDAKSEIRRLVLESVKLRMISDVPLGAFLSGGIDSSVVVAAMSMFSTRPVKTFSIGFDEKRFSELAYAKEVARMYSTEHNEFIVRDDMTNVIEKLVVNYGEPYADPSAVPSYFVSKLTSEHVKVALNGDGGDENFAGYSRYVATKLAYWIKKFFPHQSFIPPLFLLSFFNDRNAPFGTVWKSRKFLRAVSKKSINETYLSTVSFFDVDEKDNILADEFKNVCGESYAKKHIMELFNNVSVRDIIKQITYVDFNSYLSDGLMTKMDIASMANSIEARSPLLDQKLVEFTSRISSSYKLKGFTQTKYIFKEAFADMLPPAIKNRGKMGFGIPLGLWFRKELKKKFEEYCLSEKALKRGYFKEEEIKRLWSEHQSGKRDHGYKLWALLWLEMWHQRYMPDFKI
ncbi:MAG: asparagine synthase (glutamine-hydrolyzing) [Elusimicrobiales bacterium]|jgi:asparagine synthase (glutamine-hydrolysing)|nr:asparagine synthase (glutamine-hydrolyzing) [Elusimicrobiales bacterium]